MKIRILITGSGSGGHVFPLVAVARQIQQIAVKSNLDLDLRYYGPKDIYTSYITKEGIEARAITSSKLRRYFSLKNVVDFPKFIFSIFQSLFKIYWFMPDIAFSKGGPGALPVLTACRFYNIPIIIHDSDAIPGLTNTVSGKFARQIELGFTSAKKFFPASKTMRVVGNPIRESLLNFVSLDPVGAKERLKLDPKLPLILILGGSLGSVRVNNFTLAYLEKLLNKYQIVHQVGTANLANVKKTFTAISRQMDSKIKKRYHPYAFLEKNYGEMLAASDLVISRSGSGAIFELAAFGKPAILIPLPESARNHQRMNAIEYSKTGAAEVLEENNLSEAVALGMIDKLIKDSNSQMHQAALKFAKPKAAAVIAADILSLVK
jgi:UDP-N-acetylglucosamine--N-acetylmuramyl-(pentapeptide) pyrophosphoryl-undecaprenol N-acetylglucosamine transferase